MVSFIHTCLPHPHLSAPNLSMDSSSFLSNASISSAAAVLPRFTICEESIRAVCWCGRSVRILLESSKKVGEEDHCEPHLIEVQLLFSSPLNPVLHGAFTAEAVHVYRLGLQGVGMRVQAGEVRHTDFSDLHFCSYLSDPVHPGHGLEVPLRVPVGVKEAWTSGQDKSNTITPQVFSNPFYPSSSLFHAPTPSSPIC